MQYQINISENTSKNPDKKVWHHWGRVSTDNDRIGSMHKAYKLANLLGAEYKVSLYGKTVTYQTVEITE